VVLAGDNALLEDAEEADPQIPSSGIAGNSRDKVCTPTDVSGRRGRIHARRFNAILDVLCQNWYALHPDLHFGNLAKDVSIRRFFACLA